MILSEIVFIAVMTGGLTAAGTAYTRTAMQMRRSEAERVRVTAIVAAASAPPLFEPANDFERWLLAPGDETLADFLWKLDNEKKALQSQRAAERSAKIAQIKIAHQASKFNLATVLTNGVRMPPWVRQWWRSPGGKELRVKCCCGDVLTVEDRENLTGRLAEHWSSCVEARGEKMYD